MFCVKPVLAVGLWQTFILRYSNWEAKDQWCATVNFDLLVMVDYNFKGNKAVFTCL